MDKLSIVIAVYNEHNLILQVLEKIKRVEIGLAKEIIIVDGYSTDGTREILRNIEGGGLKVIYEDKKGGKGLALRKGFAAATGDIILVQDADLEIDPADYPALLGPILTGETEVVYGSRFLHGRGRTNLVSYTGNRLVTQFANMLFASRLSDMETCYKIFRPKAIEGMRFYCDGFDFDAEITARLLKNRIRIVEVPIAYRPRTIKEGKKLRWTVAIPSLWALVRVWLK